jgi:hypothetical protein
MLLHQCLFLILAGAIAMTAQNGWLGGIHTPDIRSRYLSETGHPTQLVKPPVKGEVPSSSRVLPPSLTFQGQPG